MSIVERRTEVGRECRERYQIPERWLQTFEGKIAEGEIWRSTRMTKQC